MRISIALCTYNGARYLPDQLQSIAQQTRLPDEVVICDDGSQDTTHQIIESFANNASFVVRVHLNDRNLGSTKNFEQAIRLCQGDAIALCDQDDYWYPNKLEIVEQAFAAKPEAGFVFSNADVVDDQRQRLGYSLWQAVRFSSKQQELVEKGEAVSVLLRHPVVTGTAMAFRAQFRDLILPIPPNWIHDEWIALLIAFTASVGIIREPLLEYRRHATNQVGAEGVSLVERLKVALSTNPQVYLKRYEQYQLLYDHVAQRLPDETAILSRLKEKMKHLYARGTLPRQNLRRVTPILTELVTRRYQHYSASPLNAARDLLLKH